MKKHHFVLASLAILGAAGPSAVFACACCANNNDYGISMRSLEDGALAELQQLKFASAVDVYLGAADFDAAKGLEDLRDGYETAGEGYFSVENAVSERTLRLDFGTADAKRGVLRLSLPSRMVDFRADIHDSGEPGEVSLYKEWRLKGSVEGGEGIFESSISKPASYFLVFQGRGNNCDSASDFTHWRLEIEGENAGYKLTGKMLPDH